MSGPLIRVMHDESRRDLRDPGRPRPIRLYWWEPTDPVAVPAPLVVVSHGTGGSGSDMEWLVRPLVEAGFEVAALDHHGNNYVDGYEPEGFIHVWDRPMDVSFALDALASERPSVPVGVAGFSLGAYTATALVGARVNSHILQAIWSGAIPLPEIPEYPGVLDALRTKYGDGPWQQAVAGAGDDYSDDRVRAVFLVAPGVGRFLTAESLAAVRVPVAIRWGGSDSINPYEQDTRPYLDCIPTATGQSAGAEVRHEDFFAPEPANQTVRFQVGAQAAGFFLEHLAARDRG
jgi:predicted dienelactone hydrolase